MLGEILYLCSRKENVIKCLKTRSLDGTIETWMYGLNKLYLLMEKQHNRGQEGAGLACVKLEANPAFINYIEELYQF